MPGNGNSSGESRERINDQLTRRKLVRMGAGAVGMSALAGCPANGSGGSSNGSNSGGTGAGGQLLDDELTLPATRYSPNYQWNTFNQKSWVPRYIANIMYPRLGFFTADGKWIPVAAKEWSFPSSPKQGTEATITLRDGLTWHNGDKVTATDYVRHYQLNQSVYGVLSQIDSFEAVDEKTIKAVVGSKVSPEILKGTLLYANGSGRAGSPNYKEYKKAIGKNGELSESLAATLVGKYTIEKPIGHGPWKHVETNNQYMQFEAVDNYPIGDVVSGDPLNIPSVRVLNVTDSLQMSTSSDKLDQVTQQRFLYKDSNLPGDHAQVRNFAGLSGFNLTFDHRKKYLGKRRVRKALAFALNHFAINLDMAPSAVSEQERKEFAKLTTTDTVSMMTNKQAKKYLGDNASKLQKYGAGGAPMSDSRRKSNLEKATALLEAEGFTKENGQWITPDGDRWQLTIRNYGEWDWMSVSRSVMGQLNNFGIKVEQRVVTSSQFWSNASAKSDSYDLKLGTWSVGEAPKNPSHPWYTFWQSQRNDNYVFSRLFYKQHPNAKSDADLGPDTEYYMEAPMPIGDPDGDVKRVNLTPKIKELGRTSDPQRIRDLTLELAWFHNQMVMDVPLLSFLRNSMVTTDHWNWEPKDGPLNTMAAHIDRTGFPLGLVKGKKK